MQNDITHYATTRFTSKAFNPDRKIPDEIVEKLKTLLRFSPSSVNSQPWHFVLVSTQEGKEKVAKGTDRLYPFNSDSVRDASHVLVVASRLAFEDDHMLNVLEQEDKDGRFDFDKQTLKPQTHGARNLFANIHKHDLKDLQHWMDKQVYLNIGQFLLGAATLGVDVRPMEGIEIPVIDEEFDLRTKGFTTVAVLALGYHDAERDFNARTPKSRLPMEDIMTLA